VKTVKSGKDQSISLWISYYPQLEIILRRNIEYSVTLMPSHVGVSYDIMP